MLRQQYLQDTGPQAVARVSLRPNASHLTLSAIALELATLVPIGSSAKNL